MTGRNRQPQLRQRMEHQAPCLNPYQRPAPQPDLVRRSRGLKVFWSEEACDARFGLAAVPASDRKRLAQMLAKIGPRPVTLHWATPARQTVDARSADRI